jgi:hypothetical protein
MNSFAIGTPSASTLAGGINARLCSAMLEGV